MATPTPTPITYVYLKPELNQPSYKTWLPIILVGGIITLVYYIGKRSLKSNPCDGEMAPFISSFYGWTNKDYVDRCINQKQGFTTMESANSESNEVYGIIQWFSTNISLMMNQLKR